MKVLIKIIYNSIKFSWKKALIINKKKTSLYKVLLNQFLILYNENIKMNNNIKYNKISNNIINKSL